MKHILLIKNVNVQTGIYVLSVLVLLQQSDFSFAVLSHKNEIRLEALYMSLEFRCFFTPGRLFLYINLTCKH